MTVVHNTPKIANSMRVTSSEANGNLGHLLELVRSDNIIVTITRYGRPIAELRPPEKFDPTKVEQLTSADHEASS